jgi:NCAIR mutase (PurE)-related protein
MDQANLERLLKDVKRGKVSVDEAVASLKDLPFAALGYATVDTHRALRMGVPEVVFGASKTVKQLLGIVKALDARKQSILVTRAKPEAQVALKAAFPRGEVFEEASIFRLKRGKPRAGTVAILSAGTSDMSVAEEAAITAESLGATVRRVYDVGVAGLHRLLRRRAELEGAHAVVVVAGMEGALASVAGGLVSVPVIAVPTSVGYGASFGGVAALLTMINSCASNVATVNIDNGFGGGFLAALISRTQGRR